jgi:peptide/nickel transport system permease protein
MLPFLVRRALLGIVILFTVVTFTFILIQSAPGEPFAQALDNPSFSPAQREVWRRYYGLDRPVSEQYARYLGRIIRGDLGESYSKRLPVREVIGRALPRTLMLMGAAMAVGFALGIGIGALQGWRAGSRLDRALSAATVGISAIPEFWLGIGLLLLFASRLHWLPTTGMVDDTMHAYMSPAGKVMDVARHLILPASSLALLVMAVVARQQRAALIDALPDDYVRTARAKGVSERGVVLRHALRNAMLPTITLIGLALPSLVGGAVFVESIYSWPGMGMAALDAVTSRDQPVVLGVVVVASVFVVLGSLLTDLLYAIADPRLRHA